MQLDYTKGSSPLYYQIKELLKKKIEEEEYGQGDILPSEAQLQEVFNVSRITVRQAINDLVTDGYLSRTRGKGTTVIFNKIDEHLSKIMSFTEEMKIRGLVPLTKFSKISLVKASKIIAKGLNVDEETEIYKLERLRYANNQPMVFFITYLKKELNLSLESSDYNGSLYELLNENNHISPVKAKEYFEAIAADEIISQYLEIEKGSPVLKRTRMSYDALGNSLEYSICYYRADKYRYSIEIE